MRVKHSDGLGVKGQGFPLCGKIGLSPSFPSALTTVISSAGFLFAPPQLDALNPPVDFLFSPPPDSTVRCNELRGMSGSPWRPS